MCPTCGSFSKTFSKQSKNSRLNVVVQDRINNVNPGTFYLASLDVAVVVLDCR